MWGDSGGRAGGSLVEPPPLAALAPQAVRQGSAGGAGAGDPQECVPEPAVVFEHPTVLPRLTEQEFLHWFPIGVRDSVAEPHDRPSVSDANG
jgi:hypothetical protein